MPDPREAVYDVLLAKKRRADEAKRLAALRDNDEDAWEAYERNNNRAHADYMGRKH